MWPAVRVLDEPERILTIRMCDFIRLPIDKSKGCYSPVPTIAALSAPLAGDASIPKSRTKKSEAICLQCITASSTTTTATTLRHPASPGGKGAWRSSVPIREFGITEPERQKRLAAYRVG